MKNQEESCSNTTKLETNTHPEIDSRFLVVTNDIDEYQAFDDRAIKPIIFNCEGETLVVDRLDIISLKNNPQTAYVPPNPIALQLRIVNDCIEKMKDMNIHDSLYNRASCNLAMALLTYLNSQKIYDYLSLAHQSIVFSYTALETFVNLSIPDSYIYEKKTNKNGVIESYNKTGIERYIPLKEKIKNILVPVCKTKPIQEENFWSQFIDLERYRNTIIHQKSTDRVVFYRDLFQESLFSCVKSVERIIDFFRVEGTLDAIDSLLWPWSPNESPHNIPHVDTPPEKMMGYKGIQPSYIK